MSSPWRNGNISRIYLKDFLTYDEITLYPKPYLNVIIGPNGTGKSSILCAICLGLAGNPEVTGRGKQVLEYIKHGKEEAVIELELYHTNGNIIIKRCFSQNISKKNADNKWYLQGQHVPLQKIKETAAFLGIQVNNLCQFLPQDRVNEFAKLNKIQLLGSTERAVGEKELADQHDILCQNGKTLIEKEAKLGEVIKQLNNEVSKNDKVEEQVLNIRNKDQLEIAINNLKKVIAFKKYTTAFAKYHEYKELSDSVKQEYALHKREIEPKQKELEEINRKIARLNSAFEKQKNESKTYVQHSQILSKDWTNTLDKIKDSQAEYKVCEDHRERLLNEIADHKRQLEVLKGQVEDLQKVDENALLLEIKSFTSEIHVKSVEYTELQNSTTGYEKECKDLNNELKNISLEKSRCEDICQQRLNILNSGNQGNFSSLHRQYKQIYSATVEYLHKNRLNFSGKVYGPLFTNIDLIDQNFAKYIETTISRRDLIAFVCEEKDDVDLLKRKCDANNWSVNVLHYPAVNPDKFQPRIPIEHLRQFGFEIYLKDVIRAPDAIISYLCQNFHIHNIPVSLKERLTVEFHCVPDQLHLFFCGDNRVGTKKSIYDHKSSFSVSRVNRPFFLTITNNSEKVKYIDQKLMAIKDRQIQLVATLQQQRLQLEETNVTLEKLRTLKNNALHKKNQRLQLEEKYRSKEALIQRKEASIPDLEVAAIKMNDAISADIRKLASITEKCANDEDELARICQRYIETCLNVNKENQTLVNLQCEMKDSTELLEDLKKRAATADADTGKCKGLSKTLLLELYALLEIQAQMEIPPKITQELKKGAKEDMVVLERKLAEKEVSKDCLVSADEKILEEYNKRNMLIEKLKKDVETTVATIDKEKAVIAKCQKDWLPKVTALISKINQHFSEFMSRLECAGEVHLEKGDNENDFSKYGIAIKVKFRDTEKLMDLTAHQQSGGERSVSTALYLLALQTLTAVPFRCVDEINQGMDPANERNMFTMLVETTSSEIASQYFLVTPKLLPDLPHNSRVNFAVVFNGTKLQKPKYISIKKNIQQLKKKKEKETTIRRSKTKTRTT